MNDVKVLFISNLDQEIEFGSSYTKQLISNVMKVNKFDDKNSILHITGSEEAAVIVLAKVSDQEGLFGSNSNDYLGGLRNLSAKVAKSLRGKIFDKVVFIKNNLSCKEMNELVIGFHLGNYSFNSYFSSPEDGQKSLINDLVVENQFDKDEVEAVVSGILLSRDLGNEPSNILTPSYFVEQIKKLSELGLEIDVIDKSEMEKLGMNSLLAVAKGSIQDPFTVIIRWNGKGDNSDPISFVGKGVTFDSGGISIKPSNKMEEMKFDMCGAATVVGLMKTLALRKAKVNVIGAVGLVENMPSGSAQKPGDIVKSMSGKTIEVTNTDAEGRMVLVDVLHLVKTRFNPKFIVDIATLTGSVCVALGLDYAGLFSSNDELANQILTSGFSSGEKIWRMPMDSCYDRKINSKFADVINAEPGRYAGSITAAHFLKRFLDKDTVWAHIDIAGTSSTEENSSALNPFGATGYGIKLLNELVKSFYEE